MKSILYISGIALSLCLTACAKTSAPDYQGTWKNSAEDAKFENALVISKNADNYFITNTLKDKESGKTEKKNPVPASLSQTGLLQVNAGTGPVEFAIDEKTGNLVGSGAVYKKVK